MSIKKVISTLFCFIPLFLMASSDLTGLYEVRGVGAETHEPYHAILEIGRVDSLYTALWTFDNGTRDIGTGVKEGNSLSIVFYETNRNVYGTQLYEIHDKHLEGPWVRLGALHKGFEKAKKIHCSCDSDD